MFTTYQGHYITSEISFTLNTWYHIVIKTFNNSTMNMYVNNSNKGGSSRSGYKNLDGNFIGIGRRGKPNNVLHDEIQTGDFSIAGLRIYNRALSDDEITLLYNEYKNNIV